MNSKDNQLLQSKIASSDCLKDSGDSRTSEIDSKSEKASDFFESKDLQKSMAIVSPDQNSSGDRTIASKDVTRVIGELEVLFARAPQSNLRIKDGGESKDRSSSTTTDSDKDFDDIYD